MTSPPSADPCVVSIRATGRSPVHKQRGREVWCARLPSCFFRLASWLFVSGCSLPAACPTLFLPRRRCKPHGQSAPTRTGAWMMAWKLGRSFVNVLQRAR